MLEEMYIATSLNIFKAHFHIFYWHSRIYVFFLLQIDISLSAL